MTASKDLGAYVALETTKPEPFENTEFVALDDVSVARRLADEYSDHGIDPLTAYAQENDPLIDFGGTEAFR